MTPAHYSLTAWEATGPEGAPVWRFHGYRRVGVRWVYVGEFEAPLAIPASDLWMIVRDKYAHLPVYVHCGSQWAMILPADVTQDELDDYSSLMDDGWDAGMEGFTPGQKLAAWVECVGPVVAGRVILRGTV